MEFLKSWQFWNIVIIIAIVIVGIYLIYLLISIIFSISLNKKINKKAKGINLIVVQRYDMLTILKKYFEDNNIEINEQVKDYLNSDLYLNNPLGLDKDQREHELHKLSKAYTGLMYIADAHKEIKQETTFIEYTKNLYELDAIYRQAIAKYNSDISAYNYWVTIFVYKWFFKMIKFRKKDIIV